MIVSYYLSNMIHGGIDWYDYDYMCTLLCVHMYVTRISPTFALLTAYSTPYTAPIGITRVLSSRVWIMLWKERVFDRVRAMKVKLLLFDHNPVHTWDIDLHSLISFAFYTVLISLWFFHNLYIFVAHFIHLKGFSDTKFGGSFRRNRFVLLLGTGNFFVCSSKSFVSVDRYCNSTDA